VLITGHRRENFGDGFLAICEAIRQLAATHPDVHFVYPVHLNPNVQNPVYDLISGHANIHLIDPLEYEPFVFLLKHAYLVLTDSGGIQEEAPSLGKPVLVMRNALQSNYSVQKHMVYRHLTANTPARTLIISNPVECNIDEYLMEFDTSRVHFVSFKNLKPKAVAQSDTAVLILNGTTAWMSNMDWEDMPGWVQQPDSSRVLLEQQGGIEWYGLNKADLMRRLQ
jgi:hypothetical protein